MATTFQLKRSSVEGKQPNVADLQVGELAVNLADGILYSKNTAGNIIVVGSSTTSNVTEGVNLYFTNTRAVSALTAGSGLEISSNGLLTSTVDVSGLTLENIFLTLYEFPVGDYKNLTEDAYSGLGELLAVAYDCKSTFPSGSGVLVKDLEVL